MEAGKFSFKFSRQTQKNLVGSSKYAYFSYYTFWKDSNCTHLPLGDEMIVLDVIGKKAFLWKKKIYICLFSPYPRVT
jgi:hypothetical protein